MNKKKKIILYISLLIISILICTLSLSFNVNGILGFILVLLSIYLFVGCLIKLIRLSNKFKIGFLSFLDLLFWLP